MDVKPAAAKPTVNRDDSRQADLAQEDSLVQPDKLSTTRDRATHSTNACRSGMPTGKASTCLADAADTQRIRASLSSP